MIVLPSRWRRWLFALGMLPLPGLILTGCIIHIDSLNPEPAGPRHDPPNFADPVLNQRRILLFGDIDDQSAERAIQQLMFLDGQNQEPIDLYLMTPGGEFKSALAIEHVFHVIKSPVNTYALSECNSGGALLLAAGTGKRKAFRGAVVIVHGIKVQGRPPPGMLENVQDAYTKFWHKRAKLPETWLPIPPDTLHVLSAEQALQYGIVDEIIER